MTQEPSQAAAYAAVTREVRDYITTNFLYDGGPTALADNASLVHEGVLDPTGVLELVLWIEDAYGIMVGEDDLGPEHFDSIASIARYITHRMTEE